MTLRRLACVDVPDLPLQMLLRQHSDWRTAPVALVAEERPEAPLLLLNRHARAMRLATGMRFGAAKSLVPELRAGAVVAVEVEQMVAQLVRDLQTFSPHVERDPVSAGVFYVDPSGLTHLYGGELSWARCVQRYLMARHFHANVMVAFGRALSHALVRNMRGVRAVDSVEAALELAREVPFERIPMQPKLRSALERLGLATLGDLAALGKDPLALRFGGEAARWSAVARGEEVLPLCPEPHLDTPRAEVEIDPPDHDVARLCFAIKQALDALLESVRQRGGSVRALWLRLAIERVAGGGGESVQRLEPSEATRNAPMLLELLRLRLTAMALTGNVERVVLEAELSDLSAGQLAMFGPKRDLAAGDRALARIKASYGHEVVCRAVLEDAHLPEARYRWVGLAHIEQPASRSAECTEDDQLEPQPLPLVRRLLLKPEPLSGSLELDEQTGALALVHAGEPLQLTGPYRISGGWWVREVSRDYYYARTPRDELLWVFFDRPRKAWFLHARVD
jgi:protein ImuB